MARYCANVEFMVYSTYSSIRSYIFAVCEMVSIVNENMNEGKGNFMLCSTD